MTDEPELGRDDHDSADPDDHRTGGNVVPLRRTEPSDGDSDASVWRIERVETAPMTPEQYDAAVRAFSALVRQWLAQQNDGTSRQDGPGRSGKAA